MSVRAFFNSKGVSMRSLFVVLVLLVACGCDTVTENEQLERNKPVKIAESDGVTVWKVKDSTSGGRMWVYYTTPDGRVLE